MKVNINPIDVLSFDNVYKSQIIELNAILQVERLDVTSSRSDVLLASPDLQTIYVDEVPIKDILEVVVLIEPNASTKSGPFEITLTNDKIKENTIIAGVINARRISKIPEFNVTGSTNTTPFLQKGSIKWLMDQNRFDNSDVSFTATPGFIIEDVASFTLANTDYEVKSKNNITIGSDAFKIDNAVSIDFEVVSGVGKVSVTLTNPNAGRPSLEDYNFNIETEYIINFSRELTVNGKIQKMSFVINLDFKSTPIIFKTRRIQRAQFDTFSRDSLIVYDFILNKNIDPKQFKFGIDNKVFKLPVTLITSIPNAQRLPFESNGASSLETIITAQAISLSVGHYTLKIVIQIRPLANRSLIEKFTEIPFVLDGRGFKVKVNIPVTIRGNG